MATCLFLTLLLVSAIQHTPTYCAVRRITDITGIARISSFDLRRNRRTLFALELIRRRRHSRFALRHRNRSCFVTPPRFHRS